jgi:hypothetical protein
MQQRYKSYTAQMMKCSKLTSVALERMLRYLLPSNV